jgi:serine/threonine protein kinase
MSASADESKGTWSHMAPELLIPGNFGLHDARVSKQADIYAFGVVVYEVLTGYPPFGGKGRWETTMRIIKGERPSKPENAEDIGFGGGTWEFVQRCWHQRRDERPTAEDIRKHFRRVARTSTVVPPGSAKVVREVERSTAPGPESRSDKFSKHLLSCARQTNPHLGQHRQPNCSSPLLKQV